MREIDLNQAVVTIPKNTFVIYGPTRTGKTRFAATFPRPLFLSDVTEGGWESIANMPDDQLFEPDVKPIVWGIEQMTDMATARDRAAPLIASGRVQTVVVDSLSYYADLILNGLLNAQAKKDTRAAYGDLGTHLRDLRVKTHTLGAPSASVNVVWLCLSLDPEDGDMGRPMIPGQQAAKFMAGCHYIFHSRVYQEKRGQEFLPAVYEMRTRKFNNYIAGNRLGAKADQLPDPLIGTYSTMMEHLGYSPDDIRERLPKILAAGSNTARPIEPYVKPQPTAKPPVVRVVRPAPATNVVPHK